MTPDGNEYEAQWWQSYAPPGITMHNRYRILPNLEPGLEEQLRQETLFRRDGPAYVFKQPSITGWRVLAVEMAGMNTIPGPDTVSTYTYLMRPMAAGVFDRLRQWISEPKQGRVRGGIFEMACAGAIGDPSDKRILREGRLSDEEIDRIGEFYQFYE